MERLEIPLNDGDRLVAEVNPNKPFREIFIGIVNQNDVWVQDLAVVGQDYEIEDDLSVKNVDNIYRIRLWTDERDENITHDFTVRRYPGEQG